MNSLTVNLHLLLVSFYRPTKERYKILVEGDAFPSDKYAVASQVEYHGYDPTDAVMYLRPRQDEITLQNEDILTTIKEHGASIATIMLGGVNYYTGQLFDMAAITHAGHAAGCQVGFDLAHAAGNVSLDLHHWGVDFAAWCSYKYLNSGPGGIAGAFVHERHLDAMNLPRFNGWWGHDKASRFAMPDDYVAIPTAEAWQLSNPPILQLASLQAALDIFSSAGLSRLIEKSRSLTGYLEFLMGGIDNIEVLTPRDASSRGCQLSLKAKGSGRDVFDDLSRSGIICDWREPDVIRVAPVPLYNSFEDVYRFASTLKTILGESS